ncbi:MAG: sulfite oxidase heme-binding subunit YedZ [Aestuariivirgaceae bacterium]
MKPWTDRSGRLSPLKLAVLLAVLMPALWIGSSFSAGRPGPLPFDVAISETGKWTIRLLLLSLLVTPLQRLSNWPRLIIVRRMIGLGALAYGLLHFSLYVADQGFHLAHVFSEVARRIYLTIGFVALAGLAILGATSSDAVIRRMGRHWKQLHRIVYGLAVLAIVHFFLQAKIDASEATLMAGFFILLMTYRLALAYRLKPSPQLQIAVALASAFATAALEFAWYGLATGIDPLAVLSANFSYLDALRPAPLVLIAGLALMAIGELLALIRQAARAMPIIASPRASE